MKTGDAAKRLGVSNRTILNWTERFQEFLSDGAKPGAGLQRDFTHQDLIVLNTVRAESTQNTSWDLIGERLRSGKLDENLPIDSNPLEGESALAISAQLARITSERDQYMMMYEQEQQRSEDLLVEVRRQDREIAVLKYRLEQLEKTDEDE